MRFLVLAAVFLAGCLGSDPYRRLAADLAGPLGDAKRRVAVLPFRGVDPALNAEGEAVSERLLANLYGRAGVELVERSRLQQVLSELRLGQTGAIDLREAASVGRLSGAEAVVVGTLSRSKGGLAVSARVVDVGSGRVLSASTTHLSAALNSGSPQPAAQRSYPPPPVAAPPRSAPEDWRVGTDLGSGERLPWPLSTNGTAVLNRRLYVLGGVSPRVKGAGQGDRAVISAPFGGNGHLGRWRAEELLPQGRYQLAGAAWDRWIFAVGGSQGSPRPEIFVAEVGSEGRLGPWRNAGSLPVACNYPGAAAERGLLHVAGCGTDSGGDAALHSSSIGPEGTLGPWKTLSISGLPANPRLVASRDRLFLVGGVREGGGYGDMVIRVDLGQDGTPRRFSTAGRMPVGAASLAVARVGTRLWIAGGYVNRTRGGGERPESRDVQWAALSPEGMLGAWNRRSTTLVAPIAMMDGVSLGGTFLVVGGEEADGNTDALQRFVP